MNQRKHAVVRGHMEHSHYNMDSPVLELPGATVVAGMNPVVTETQRAWESQGCWSLGDLLFWSLQILILNRFSGTCYGGNTPWIIPFHKQSEGSVSPAEATFLTVYGRAGDFLPQTLIYLPEIEDNVLVGSIKILNIKKILIISIAFGIKKLVYWDVSKANLCYLYYSS